jgi:hypothetical protein
VDEAGRERRAHKRLGLLGRGVDVIADDAVVPELEACEASLLGILGLQRRDHATAVVAKRARLIKGTVKASCDEAAFSREKRKFVAERGGKVSRQHCRLGQDRQRQGRACIGDLGRRVI